MLQNLRITLEVGRNTRLRLLFPPHFFRALATYCVLQFTTEQSTFMTSFFVKSFWSHISTVTVMNS